MKNIYLFYVCIAFHDIWYRFENFVIKIQVQGQGEIIAHYINDFCFH